MTSNAYKRYNENIEKMCNIYKTINFYNKASNSGNVINATKKGV